MAATNYDVPAVCAGWLMVLLTLGAADGGAVRAEPTPVVMWHGMGERCSFLVA